MHDEIDTEEFLDFIDDDDEAFQKYEKLFRNN